MKFLIMAILSMVIPLFSYALTYTELVEIPVIIWHYDKNGTFSPIAQSFTESSDEKHEAALAYIKTNHEVEKLLDGFYKLYAELRVDRERLMSKDDQIDDYDVNISIVTHANDPSKDHFKILFISSRWENEGTVLKFSSHTLFKNPKRLVEFDSVAENIVMEGRVLVDNMLKKVTISNTN